MTKRPLSICKRPGCPALIPTPGYCAKHATDAPDPRAAFDALDDRKTAESRAFYSSARWTRTSKRHRVNEPLCRRCRAEGRIRAADAVHHNPPLNELLAAGLNPYDEQYLESICNQHHLAELRAKR